MEYRRTPAIERGPNRGVAVYGNRVYFGTPDACLVALDARTGNLLWEVKLADPSEGYWCPVAPLPVKDKIIVGIAPGDHGLNGWLDAYDAETGKQAWRWHAIPKPGEPGSETWAGESWKTGGGNTWLTGSFDPALNLIYWGIGNPAPDFDGDVRKGDNLYTECMVALDADTGKLKWYFQFTPHDVTTGMRSRFRCWSTPRFRANPASSWCRRIETGTTTFSIEPRANSCWGRRL